MPFNSRGRSVGGELVSYRRSSVDPFAEPAPARAPNQPRTAFHSDECECPRCAKRATERSDRIELDLGAGS
jgi:hypothetical protein